MFCSQFLNDAPGSQMRHQQRCYEYRHDDGFCTIDSNITGGSHSRQHERENAFEWNLQNLNNSEHNQPRT
jgi:hypothetical protein